ncbi:MAG: type II secretion system major pseudopilin GspG [Puniceicoccales bacterium]|jgi:general secretion pathway protein G|nr:type II secretion system major pseudopilin GspG [Puniceicoccales bacterium]
MLHNKRMVEINRDKRSGFSLIEILIALALMGMILGLIVVNSESIFGGGQKKVTGLFVSKVIDVPLMAYRAHIGNYPSTEEGLDALLKAPSGKAGRWQGPYVKNKDDLIDPWGNPYQYRYPGSKNKSGYDVWSMGPGGQSGDGDDIGNWKNSSED